MLPAVEPASSLATPPPPALAPVSLATPLPLALFDVGAAFDVVLDGAAVLLFSPPPPSPPLEPESPCCTAICAVLPDAPAESYTHTCTLSA